MNTYIYVKISIRERKEKTNTINISDVVEIGKMMLSLIFATGIAHILHYNIQDNNKNNERKLEKQNSSA